MIKGGAGLPSPTWPHSSPPEHAPGSTTAAGSPTAPAATAPTRSNCSPATRRLTAPETAAASKSPRWSGPRTPAASGRRCWRGRCRRPGTGTRPATWRRSGWACRTGRPRRSCGTSSAPTRPTTTGRWDEMAWSAPMTAVANSTITASQFNQYFSDNWNETSPAKDNAASGYFVGDSVNSITERFAVTDLELDEGETDATDYGNLDSPANVGPTVTLETGPSALIIVRCSAENSGTGSARMA